ncbi:hypothetical protein ACQ9BO_01415 [Flavobacterium sp. P21]|uniref:hypothetical protein n=1 Tax=Flavobacterium sp. P21 TaxID=3423948 RepID=UPI003D66809C
MYDEWLETKKQFRTGLIVSSIIVFASLIFPRNKINTSQENFVKETVILSTNPVFDHENHGKTRRYFVKLNFKGDNREYRIESIDYNFLHYNNFIHNIKSGDTLDISRSFTKIHSLSKNNYDYLNFAKAETNRGLVINFFGYLFIPMILICIIVQFFKKRPYYTFNDKRYPLPFDIITIVIFITTIIILVCYMPDFQIIENGKIYGNVYKIDSKFL